MPLPAIKSTAMLQMLAAMLCFACMSTAIHALQGMSIFQMVFVRNLISLGIMIGWVLILHRGFGLMRTRKMGKHFWRSLVGVIGMHLWFYSLVLLPLNTAMALSFTVPIFGTIQAVLFLGERAGIRRWAAIIIGFIGVLIIIRPGSEMFTLAVGVALGASVIIALTGTMIKSLTRTEHPDTIIVYMAIFMTLFSAPMAVWEWQPVSGDALALLVIIGVFSTAAHLLMTRAFQKAELVALLPLDYTRLVFTAVLAYVFFDEVITGHTVLGALIIMGSTLYIAHREALKKKSAASL